MRTLPLDTVWGAVVCPITSVPFKIVKVSVPPSMGMPAAVKTGAERGSVWSVGRKVADEKLEGGVGVKAGLEVTRGHSELVEVG